MFVAFGLFIILGVRLFSLQVIRSSYYEAVAASQRKRGAELVPHRGTIYVSDGREKDLFPIAVNKKAWTAYAVPRDMDNPTAVVDQLTPALIGYRHRQRELVETIMHDTGQNKLEASADAPPPSPTPTISPEDEVSIVREQLLAKFNQKADPYEPFLRQYEALDDELRQFLEEKKLPGIELEEKEIRFYPEKTLAAHALGYLGWYNETQSGRYGVEGFLDNILAGDFGFLSAERDTSGRVIGVAANEFRPAQDGANVVLTLDRVVQDIAEQTLADGVKRYGAKRGSVIVMNPKTGAIIGMATYPTYDPNYYYAITDGRVQVNPSVSDNFEPGSILKPIVMAMGIEEGTVTSETTMVDNGPVKVADRVINTFDGKHAGRITMTNVLEQSNNVGMVWLGQQLGAELMYDYFRRFGLGERTGVELEGETQSNVPAPHNWNITTVATASFGQGIAMTPLQALNTINVIANNGNLMQPFLVSAIQGSDNQEHVREPVTVRHVISEGTANQVKAMMVSVIENGVAQLARVPGYYLAGKTGTAQVPDETGHYSPDRKIISFVGFGPARDPHFSILIKLDDPAGLSFASGTAAPMFRTIAEKLLNYYQIAPDYPLSAPRPTFKITAHDYAG